MLVNAKNSYAIENESVGLTMEPSRLSTVKF